MAPGHRADGERFVAEGVDLLGEHAAAAHVPLGCGSPSDVLPVRVSQLIIFVIGNQQSVFADGEMARHLSLLTVRKNTILNILRE